jgi:putative ABC transport system permease protein
MNPARALVRSPGFTLLAVGVLAAGIGANTAMFSVVRAVLLDPVPWPEARRLVLLQEVKRGDPNPAPASPANYLDWRTQSRSFERMEAMRFVYLNLSDDRDAPDRVQALRVSSGFFPMIGVRPALGRLFTPEDDRPGRDRMVLLANGFWRRRYGSDPAIVGKTITVEGEACTVAGVLPEFPMFQVLNRELDLYMPLAFPESARSRNDHSIGVYARLRPEVNAAQAQDEMEAIARRIEAAYPRTNAGWSVRVQPIVAATVARFGPQLEFLMAAAGMVLLIACANAAGLMLAWSLSRRRELAIRMALGAPRRRIVGQLLGESLLLGLIGGAAGVLLAAWAAAGLERSISHTMLGRMTGFRIDLEALVFAVGISVVASVLFGLAPALRASSFTEGDLMASAAARGSTGRQRGARLLVACEAALATALLIGAAAAARNTLRLLAMDRGIDIHNVLTAQIWIPASRYPTPAAERQLVSRVLERVRALPGVEGATVVNYPALGLLGTETPFDIEGLPPPAPGEARITRFSVVDPDYFRMLRQPVISGRAFTNADGGTVMVSETFARRFFPGESAVGQAIYPRFPAGDAYWYPASTNGPLTIAGVVRDLREDAIDVGPMPQIYLPYEQNPSRILHLLVRTRGAPLAWAAPLRGVMQEIDRDEPLFDIKPYEEIPRQTFSRQTVFGAILAGASGLALLLAVTGIYVLLAWSVARRTREIGIRMAIGAAPSDMARFALWEAMAPAAAGVAAGIAGALALHGVLTKLVPGLTGIDLAAFAAGPAVLLAASAAATAIPVRKAMKVDPVSALRLE